jgi:hypothetical protein
MDQRHTVNPDRLHGTHFATVREFADFFDDLVVIVDLVDLVPELAQMVG